MNRKLRMGLLTTIVAAASIASSDSAASERFAIILGANVGDAGETPLLYAERDAQRVAETLSRLGQVPSENALLLLSPDKADLDRALTAMAARIQRAAAMDAPQTTSATRPIVFFYYSGHADALALHLGGTRYPFGELKKRVTALGADVAVFFIDACRSGGIIRAKGARPAQPFNIQAEDTLKSKGIAIITSSSESEDAQESDRLGGGVFTHHLLVGLSGAADASGDARIDLSEAYRYAWSQTVAATSATAVVQHPTFAFDLSGERDIMLTRTDQQQALGRLRLPGEGHYLIFERFGARDLAAELHAQPSTELLLTPGKYLVRRRETATVWEMETTVVAGAVADLADVAFARIPYRHAVRKGYGQSARSAISLGADFEVQGPVTTNASWGTLGAVTLQLDFAEIAIKARLRFGHSVSDVGPIDLSEQYLGFDAGIYHIFDLGSHGLGFGLRAGLDWVSQTFTTPGEAAARDQLLPRFGPAIRAEFALSPTVVLNLDAGADGWIAEVLGRDGRKTTQVRVAPIFTVGFGVLLP